MSCGFALDEYAVDGDWEAFNFCTAENFYVAMLEEDFEFLGESSVNFIENIMYWLNYDGQIGKEHEEDIEKIRTGMFMTSRNRTFIDAIADTKNVSFAETYICFGSVDVRLYVICMFGIEIDIIDGEEMYNGTILNMINRCCSSKEEYVEFLSKLFSLLDSLYNEITDNDKKKEFLDVLLKNISKFRFSCSEKIGLKDVCSPGFARVLINR